MDVAECRWHEPGGADAAQTIAAFLESIGIGLQVGAVEASAFLPGLAIEQGTIRIDPAMQVWPGDLLHEAGHIAVTEPEKRASLDQPGADAGEEMAAIAWSVAAARACGVGLDVLFHLEGYKGDAAWLAAEFAKGNPFGVPLLGWYGLTNEAQFPAMSRWLR